MKACILTPFHDVAWQANALANVERAQLPAVFVLNGSARSARPPGVAVVECDGDSHASAFNAGVEWAREQGFDAVLSFDSDDYYGPAYAASTLRGLAEADVVGRKQIFAQLQDGTVHRFERPGRPFLFATIGFRPRNFLPVNDILDNCGDWCDRMQANGASLLELPSDGYCYRRHGNNAHWQLPDDVFVRMAWGASRCYGKQPVEMVDATEAPPWALAATPRPSELLDALARR